MCVLISWLLPWEIYPSLPESEKSSLWKLYFNKSRPVLVTHLWCEASPGRVSSGMVLKLYVDPAGSHGAWIKVISTCTGYLWSVNLSTVTRHTLSRQGAVWWAVCRTSVRVAHPAPRPSPLQKNTPGSGGQREGGFRRQTHPETGVPGRRRPR